MLDGIDLFATRLSKVVAELRDKGWTVSRDNGGYDFPELQVGLYCPSGRIEGVSIYRSGYYDDL